MKYVHYIKWILLIIGSSRGNLIGGFVGFLVGYFIEEYLKDNFQIEIEKVFKHKEHHYTDFQKKLLALISETVKADGYIHKEEIYFIKNYLLHQFGSVYSSMMLKTLKLQIDTQFDIESICKSLKNSLNTQSKIDIVTFLFGITIQNGNIHIREKIVIENISLFLGLTKEEYKKIITKQNQQKEARSNSKNQNSSLNFNAYKILGISENATDKEVKKAYRKMVLKFHPDKTDLDDEIANEKFSEISKAYHSIKLSRNIK